MRAGVKVTPGACVCMRAGLTIQHCGNHGAMSTKPWVNQLMGLTDDLTGGSSLMWRYHHQVLSGQCGLGRGGCPMWCVCVRAAWSCVHESLCVCSMCMNGCEWLCARAPERERSVCAIYLSARA